MDSYRSRILANSLAKGLPSLCRVWHRYSRSVTFSSSGVRLPGALGTR